MATQKFDNRMDFLLWFTNYFHGHYEDPHWGSKPNDEWKFHAISSIAETIKDKEIAAQLQEIAMAGVREIRR